MLSESLDEALAYCMDEFYVYRGTAARRHVTAEDHAATRRNVTASDLLERSLRLRHFRCR